MRTRRVLGGKKRRVSRKAMLDESDPAFVGPVRHKRHRKAVDSEVSPNLSLPPACSAHSPKPLLEYLSSVPAFTASGEPETWQSCKSHKILALAGKEHDFETVFENLPVSHDMGNYR